MCCVSSFHELNFFNQMAFLVEQVPASVKKPLPVVTVQKAESEERTLPDKITKSGNGVVKVFPCQTFVFLLCCKIGVRLFLSLDQTCDILISNLV